MAIAKLVAISLLLTTHVFALSTKTLVQSRHEILKLGARLSTLEKDLGQNNNKYLASIEKIRLIETDIVNYQDRLQAVKAEATKREIELSSILRAQALAMVEDDVAQLSQYQKIIKKNRIMAQSAIAEARTLEKIVDSFQERLTILKQDEEDLLTLTLDLEKKKKEVTDVYLEKVKKTELLESQLQKQKISTKLSAIKKMQATGALIPFAHKFQAPLAIYSQALESEKGITFKFDKLQPLRAPRAGRVVYNGDLANYGKVLMLDHGDEIRTVLLGRFRSNLGKNESVNSGDILGHTEESTDSIYFEVRKKNIAQKTIHWMDTKLAGKI